MCFDLDFNITASDLIRFLGTLLATFLGAFLAYLFAGRQEQKKNTYARELEQIRNSRLHDYLTQSLLTEIDYNANQAAIYTKDVKMPAYRLITTVHDGVIAQLLTIGKLSPSDIKAILEFYSQVRQVNWCIDEANKLRRQGQTAGLSLELKAAMDEEIERARHKAAEMKSPESRFYTPVVNALRRQG